MKALFSNPIRLWQMAFCACVLAILVLALLPSSTHVPSTGWDKANHCLAFATLGALGSKAFPGRFIPLLLGLLAYGGLIEILQSFTPHRQAEWTDLLADALGLLVVWVLSCLVSRRRCFLH